MPDDDAEEGGEQVSSRPFWSGTITFGLVSIPVSLFPANRQSRVGLRMLSKKGTPLTRRYASAATGRELSADDMIRGYEIDKGKFVVVTDEELDRLAPEKSRDIDLRRFVDAKAIPPMYFERSYFLVPAGGSSKAYRLLAATMQDTDRAGIATFVMRGKEYLVAILSENGILRAETLRFSDEIRSPEDVGLPKTSKAPPAKVRDFEQAIAKLSADDIAPEEMTDDTSERLLQMARAKEKRHEGVIQINGPRKGGEVVDIMAVLQRSLGQARREAAAAQPAPKAAKTSPPARKSKPARTGSRR